MNNSLISILMLTLKLFYCKKKWIKINICIQKVIKKFCKKKEFRVLSLEIMLFENFYKFL